MGNQYRLLSGQHLHTDGRLYEAGQILVSNQPLDLIFKDEVRPRFENIAGATDRFNQVWDPRVENIEQFSARMKDLQPPKPPGGDAAVFDPKVETLDQFYQRMSRKHPHNMREGIPSPERESLQNSRQVSLPSAATQVPLSPASTSSQEITSSNLASRENIERNANNLPSREIRKETVPGKVLPAGSVTSPVTTKTDAQLNAMSLQELQSWTEDEEIELGHAKTKPEIIKAVKAHQGSR